MATELTIAQFMELKKQIDESTGSESLFPYAYTSRLETAKALIERMEQFQEERDSFKISLDDIEGTKEKLVEQSANAKSLLKDMRKFFEGCKQIDDGGIVTEKKEKKERGKNRSKDEIEEAKLLIDIVKRVKAGMKITKRIPNDRKAEFEKLFEEELEKAKAAKAAPVPKAATAPKAKAKK